MSDTSVDTPKTGFVANEPVIVGHVVVWLFANLGAFIVGHTNLVTEGQWSSFTTGLVPFVTAAVLALIAFVMRKYVSPAWKKVSGELENHGLPVPTPEQLDRLAEELYEAFLQKQMESAVVAPEPALLADQVPANAGKEVLPEPETTA